MPVLEETLTATAINGDREALAELLRRSEPELRLRLKGKIPRSFRSAFDEKDVLQVSFVEAFLRIGQFSPSREGSFLTWIARIAENNLRDAIRELDRNKRPPRRRQITASDDTYATMLGNLAGTTTTPTRHASREEVKAAIVVAIQSLPPEYATVVRMYDLEGKSIDEVGAAFEPPRRRGAVHMLRLRAHDRLRELLGDTTQFFTGKP